MAEWLLLYSGGILGELANILKLATKRAIMLGRERIDLETLAELNYKFRLKIRLISSKVD